MTADLHELIQRYMAGTITDEENATLREALKTDVELRTLYLDYMNLDVALEALAGATETAYDLPPIISSPPKPRAAWSYWRPLTAVAIAVLVLLGSVPWFVQPLQVDLQRSVGAEFGVAFHPGDLIGQSAELTAGLIEIHFRQSDAMVVIEAPAKFRIEDAKTLRMESGRVTAHVRDGQQGLRVLTPHTDVLDLGTRFAVEVRDGERSEVHVFEGKVEAGAKGVAKRDLLGTNQALRFATVGTPESRAVRSGTFVQPEELKSLAAGVQAGQAQRASDAEALLKRDAALIGWIGFENDADESQIEHGGVVKGARRVQGRFPGQYSLEFVDTDDHAKLNLKATTRQLTLLTWVRLDRVPEGISSLYHTDGWDTPGQVHWMILNNGQMRFAINGAPAAGLPPGHVAWPESQAPVLDQLGRWLHLAAVYDSDAQQVSFFTNGHFDSTVEMKTGLPAVLGPAQLGNWNFKNQAGTEHRRLSGRMDELVALSRALTAEEIRQHYEAGNPYR